MSFPMLYGILRGMAMITSLPIPMEMEACFIAASPCTIYVASCIDPTIKDCTLAAVIDVVPIRQITET